MYNSCQFIHFQFNFKEPGIQKIDLRILYNSTKQLNQYIMKLEFHTPTVLNKIASGLPPQTVRADSLIISTTPVLPTQSSFNIRPKKKKRNEEEEEERKTAFAIE